MSETEHKKTKAEIDADVDRATAEAEKFRAEAEAALITARSVAESNLAAAELARTTARDEQLRMQKLQHEVDRENEKRQLEFLAEDKHHHTYVFNDAVSSASVTACITRLRFWDRTEEPGEITLLFNSPGGAVIPGMALFDFLVSLRNRGWHLTTVVSGYAASMAGILLQAGDVRVCGPESYILIHEISAGTGGKIGDMEDDVIFYKKICDRVVDIFVGRADGKISKTLFKKKWQRHDWWLTSAEALKFGIVDEVR